MSGGSQTDDAGGRLGALRRTLEQRLPVDPASSSVDGASPWTSGVIAAVQGLAFSLAVVIVPSIAMVIAANADAESTQSWSSAVPVGARIWLLGHGVPLVTGSGTLTMVPLGVLAIAIFGVFASTRRSARPTRSAFGAGVATYAIGTFFVALLTGSITVRQLLTAVVGGALVAAVGLAWGLLSRPDADRLVASTRATVHRLPVLARLGLRGAAVATALLVGLSSVLALVWLVMGGGTMGEVLADLHLDTAGAWSLGVAQLTLVPNLVVWGLAWLVGPGFAVGAGTHFGSDFVVSGPRPAVPILGALPTGGGGALTWAPVLVAAAGAIGGWCVHRRVERIAWWHVFVLATVLGVGTGLLSGVLVGLGSGAAGPGRLGDVGASGLVVGLGVAVLTGLGALVLLVVVRPEFRELWRAWRAGRGTPPADADVAAPRTDDGQSVSDS